MNSELSDNQKRTVCRILFLVLCALPTCVVIYFATHQRTASQWAQVLQAELGVETRIGAVESPLPGEYVFTDVKLLDNDGEPIFASLDARIKLGNINRIEFRDPIQVKRKGLSHFFEEASERLVRPQANAKPWEVVFNHIEIISRRGSEFEFDHFPMDRLFVSWQNGPDGRILSFKTPLTGTSGERAEDWGRLEVWKNSQSERFNVSFNTTKRGKVPCWLASHWIPDLEKKLGKDAQFSGFAEFNSSGQGFNCDLTGVFESIQLPGSIRQSSEARMIHVNGFHLENSQWTFDKAALALNNGQFRELFKPRYDGPPRSQQYEVFDEVIRTAFGEELGIRTYR